MGLRQNVPEEVCIELRFDARADGWTYIHSPSVRGLHLAGTNLDDLIEDIEPVIKDLLLKNHQIVSEGIRWVPDLGEMAERVSNTHKNGKRTYVATIRSAA